MSALSSSRRHRKRKLKAEINVVPYIDVMLVLLIIFMVTAPLLNLGVDVQLPEAKAKPIEQPKDPVIVVVDSSGNFYLKLKDADVKAIGAGELEARIIGITQQNPEASVLIQGDGRASYQYVYDAMTLLQRGGVKKVGLLGKPEGDGRK